MNLNTDPMACRVRKRLGKSSAAQHASCGLIHVTAAYSCRNSFHCSLLGFENRFICGALICPWLAKVHRAGHIAAITLMDYTEVKGKKASAGQACFRGAPMRQSRPR